MTLPAATSPSAYGNPYIVAPDTVAAGTLVTGGGADGYIDHVVSLVLGWVNPRPGTGFSVVAPAPGSRTFDFAELISRAASAAGVPGTLPIRADQLRAYCYARRTSLYSAAVGLGLKGALLFGPEGVGLSLGSRGRVVVYDAVAGVIVDGRSRPWAEAAIVPGARGYR